MQLINSDEPIVNSIRNKAIALGFSEIGISKAQALPQLHANAMHNWLNKGYHAEMAYMSNHFEKRLDPTLLVEGAKTVISLLHNYYPSQHQLDSEAPIIARYAYGNDYHDVLKAKLQILFDYIQTEHFPNLEGRMFTDSAPVLERAWAENSGLGWIGKNANLINPKLGSYQFIAQLIVNFPINYQGVKLRDYCGGCTKCIDACPTKAIIEPRVIDSNRCISYLTIENKNDIPSEFEGLLQNRVFGCDICQEVCPWNRKSEPHNEPDFDPFDELMTMNKSEWDNLSEEQFSRLFKKSAVKRAKFAGLKRNLKFILGS